MWLKMAPYLKFSKCLLNVILFYLLLKCSFRSRNIRCDHSHHISGAIELLTFGTPWPSDHFVWRALSCGINVRPGDCLPSPHNGGSPISCSTHEPSSSISHPPPCWVTAPSASGERGETERVQSHLLFYRQPAFSPRDLIITRSVERVAHDELSHTMILYMQTRRHASTKMQANVVAASLANLATHWCRICDTRGWQCFRAAHVRKSSKLTLNFAYKQTLKVTKCSL